MPTKLPTYVKKLLMEMVYKKADDHHYILRNRTDNRKFIDSLVADPQIGGLLLEYVPKQRIRTYIKDGILNGYSKDKRREQLRCDPIEVVMRATGMQNTMIQRITHKNTNLYLHKLDSGEYYLLCEGTVLKWETALRKALEYICKTPALYLKNGQIIISLFLAPNGLSLTESDRNQLLRTLKMINVSVIFADGNY